MVEHDTVLSVLDLNLALETGQLMLLRTSAISVGLKHFPIVMVSANDSGTAHSAPSDRAKSVSVVRSDAEFVLVKTFSCWASAVVANTAASALSCARARMAYSDEYLWRGCGRL